MDGFDLGLHGDDGVGCPQEFSVGAPDLCAQAGGLVVDGMVERFVEGADLGEVVGGGGKDHGGGGGWVGAWKSGEVEGGGGGGCHFWWWVAAGAAAVDRIRGCGGIIVGFPLNGGLGWEGLRRVVVELLSRAGNVDW